MSLPVLHQSSKLPPINVNADVLQRIKCCFKKYGFAKLKSVCSSRLPPTNVNANKVFTSLPVLNSSRLPTINVNADEVLFYKALLIVVLQNCKVLFFKVFMSLNADKVLLCKI